jgi:RNA polymerase sigma-70 factor (ECF subfamily)
MNPDNEGDQREVEWAAPETHQDEMATADHRRLLEEALHKLPAAQRVPLVLYHFDDLGYEEIAAKLRVSLAKVKTDIHRGREALRRKLKLDLEGELAGTIGARAAHWAAPGTAAT